jgi:methyltransferase
MLTRVLFTLLWSCLVVQRLWEVRVSRRHERALRSAGAIEHAPEQMPWMVALHASWLAATIAEVWLLERPFNLALFVVAFALFALGQSLRIAAMRNLGQRWTVRVITPTHGEPPVSTGLYRYVRHPNYLGVALEIAAFPLLHGAYLSALVFSALNALLLRARIRAEERALCATSSYGELCARAPRFVPRGARP